MSPSGSWLLTVVRDEGRQRIDARDLEIDTSAVERYRILEDDPLSARAEVAWTIAFRRGGWRVRTETVTVMTATRDAFLLTATLDAFEGETRVLSKSWHPSIPRDMV